MAVQRLTERMQFTGGKVDRSGPYPIIRDVLLCGPASANNRDYLRECFPPGVKLYEGQPIFIDHGEGAKGRKFRDKLGWVEAERRRSDGMPIGDIGVNPKHAEAESFLWAAEHKSDFCSMSHVANCEAKRDAGRDKVWKIHNVESVDVVIDAATTKGLHESTQRGGTVTTIKAFLESTAAKLSSQNILKLRRLCEMDGVGDLPMDAPAEDAGADDGITAAFKAAFDAVRDKLFDGEIDRKAAFKKLAAIFDGHEDANAEVGGSTETEEEEGSTEESRKPKAKADGKAILDAVELCEKHGFSPKSADLKIITAVEAADREAVVKRLKESAGGGGGGPRSIARGTKPTGTRATESRDAQPAAEDRNGLL